MTIKVEHRAIIIANSKYEKNNLLKDLPNVINDFKDVRDYMSTTLFKNNFTDIVDKSASEIRAKLDLTVEAAQGRTKKNPLVVFLYYSGHGVAKYGATHIVTNASMDHDD